MPSRLSAWPLPLGSIFSSTAGWKDCASYCSNPMAVSYPDPLLQPNRLVDHFPTGVSSFHLSSLKCRGLAQEGVADTQKPQTCSAFARECKSGRPSTSSDSVRVHHQTWAWPTFNGSAFYPSAQASSWFNATDIKHQKNTQRWNIQTTLKTAPLREPSEKSNLELHRACPHFNLLFYLKYLTPGKKEPKKGKRG